MGTRFELEKGEESLGSSCGKWEEDSMGMRMLMRRHT